MWRAGVSPRPGCVRDFASGEAKADSLVPAAAAGSVVPAVATGSCDCGTTYFGLDWDSSSGDDGAYHVSTSSNQRLPAPLISGSSPPPPADSRVSTNPPVSLPPDLQSPPASHVYSTLALGPGQQLVVHLVYQKWLDIFHKSPNIFFCRQRRDAKKRLIFLVAPLKLWRLEL